MRKAMIGLLAVATFALCACGSDDGEGPGPGAGGSGSGGGGGSGGDAQGGNDCGAQQCPLGQYCDNFVCATGCMSNANCAADETCEGIDTTTGVGTCASSSQPDCDAFISKCQQCGGGTSECTQAICEGFSADCRDCLINANCEDAPNCPCGA